MKIKTSELIGAALDWAVAKCEGAHPQISYPDKRLFGAIGDTFDYSTDWTQGGPIIERERISCHPIYLAGTAESNKEIAVPNGWTCFHTPRFSWQSVRFKQTGETLLIAAMRCYVTSKLGDVVEVPDELT